MSYSWGFDNSQWYPPHNDPYTLTKFGWVQPTKITKSGTYPIKIMDSMPSPGDVHVYKIDKGFKTGEYLLLQYYRFTGPNGGSRCPGTSKYDVCEGVLIYLVDETKTGANAHNNQGYPGQEGWPANGNHYKVALLQKDRQYHLEKGDGVGTYADFFKAGDTLMPSLDPNNPVYPNTNSYQGGVVTPTNIEVTVAYHPDPKYMNLLIQFRNTATTPNPTPAPTPAPSLSGAIFPNQNFESGSMGNIFIGGGDDCEVIQYSVETAIASPNNLAGAGSGGSYCVRLRDKSGVASSAYTNLMSVAGYNSLRLEFDFYVKSFERAEDFFVEWSEDGTNWNVERRWIAGKNLRQNRWNRAKVVFDGWEAAGRPSTIAIRIRADASGDDDMLYFDNVIFFGVV
jgi:hypothetical protein